MYTIMYTIWFKYGDETYSVDAESLAVARVVWDTLASVFQMLSARP